MQELILVISKCVSKKRAVRQEEQYYQFHFKGYYAGSKIKAIHLYPGGSENLSKGVAYLLWVKRKRIYGEILEVNLIKFKKIV